MDDPIEVDGVLNIVVTGKQGKEGPQGPPGTGNGGRRRIWVVTDHGARGNGTTDDTDAIISIMGRASRGDTLFFPPGEYPISRTLVNSNNLGFEGSSILGAAQIIQTSDTTLLDIPAWGSFTVRNLWLSSMAKGNGTALIRATDPASHGLIENIAISGADKGIYLRGVLFTDLRRIMNAQWDGVQGGTAIYCERTRSRAINDLTIYKPIIQGGYINGVWVEPQRGEGGVSIYGGCIEAVKGQAVTLRGVGLYFNIQGLHNESSGSIIRLEGSKNGSITNCFPGIGISASDTIGVTIRDSYVWDFIIDDSNSMFTIDNITYQAITNLGSTHTTVGNMRCTGNASLGAYGTWSGLSNPSKVDGTLERWTASGKPEGFSTFGTVVKESAIVDSGTAAASIDYGTVAGLVYHLPRELLGGTSRPLRIRARVYKPTGGFDPRVAVVYNNWAMNTATPRMNIPAGKWTTINANINVTPVASNGFVLLGSYYNGSYSADARCIIDNVEVWW